MITGHVRDHLPRVWLPLPGRDGSVVRVEFILDTAFDGELALPADLIEGLDATYTDVRYVALAGGTLMRRPFYVLEMEWYDEPRTTEIAVLDGGNPLIGMALLEDHLLQIEVMDGGDVSIEPL